MQNIKNIKRIFFFLMRNFVDEYMCYRTGHIYHYYLCIFTLHQTGCFENIIIYNINNINNNNFVHIMYEMIRIKIRFMHMGFVAVLD